jgi:hypothetical protein
MKVADLVCLVPQAPVYDPEAGVEGCESADLDKVPELKANPLVAAGKLARSMSRGRTNYNTTGISSEALLKLDAGSASLKKSSSLLRSKIVQVRLGVVVCSARQPGSIQSAAVHSSEAVTARLHSSMLTAEIQGVCAVRSLHTARLRCSSGQITACTQCNEMPCPCRWTRTSSRLLTWMRRK